MDIATQNAPNTTCKSWSGILYIGFTGTAVSTGFRQQNLCTEDFLLQLWYSYTHVIFSFRNYLSVKYFLQQ